MYHYITENNQLNAVLPRIMEHKAWGYDLETNGLCFIKNEPLLLQLGRPDVQYLIDVRTVNIEPLRPLLESEDYFLVGHNLSFDYKMLAWNRGIKAERLRDVMMAEKIRLNGLKQWGFSLNDLLREYEGVEKDKELQKSFVEHEGAFSHDQLRYAADDVKLLLPLQKKLVEKLKADGLHNTYILECEAIPCFGDMEMHGVRLNAKKWMFLAKSNIETAQDLKLDLLKFGIVRDGREFGALLEETDFNANSPVQLQQAFAAKGYDLKDKSTMEKIKKSTFWKIVKQYRSCMTKASLFGQNFVDAIYPETGRIHCVIDQLGAETGRITSGKKNYDRKKQVNLLNIPKSRNYRSCFLPQDENYLIETDDYSGAELRILAHLSQDPELLRIFREGLDVHCVVASFLYGKEVGPEDPLRAAAKGLNFGIIYGGTPYSLERSLDEQGFTVTREEAFRLYDSYCNKYQRAVGLLRNAGKIATDRGEWYDAGGPKIKAGVLSNINGRNRYFKHPYAKQKNKKGGLLYPRGEEDYGFKKAKESLARSAGNNLVQSANAEITKLAMINIRKHIIRNRIRSNLMLQVYDEIVTDTHKEDSAEFVIKKRQLMVEAAERWITSVPFKVEGRVAEYWAK